MPALLFATLALLLSILLAVDRHFRRLRAASVSAVGRPARMHYAAVDRFGLTARLIAEPTWAGRAPGIEVKDVLYASAGGERCFICTAKTRASPDAPASRTLVRFIESTADGSTRDLATLPSASVAHDVVAYRELIDGWLVRRGG